MPDEFVGPFASWTNLKTAYNAKGDGKADDTRALQQALDELSENGKSNVLYLPAGVYKITSTLVLRSKMDVSIFGEDPEKVIITWAGAKGGTMLLIDGAAYSQYGRITWEGNGVAETAVLHEFDIKKTVRFANTASEHADEIFRNCEYGIRTGGMYPNGKYGQDAECTVMRCRFINCSNAGFAIADWNDLDWFLWDCWFEDCGIGATNDAGDGGAGNFHVYRSVFLRSKETDIKIGVTNYFSFRYNVSKDSRRFLQVSRGANTNGALITLQKNIIWKTKDSLAIVLYTKGNVLALDNSFIAATGNKAAPVYMESPWGNGLPDITLVGNKTSTAKLIKSTARIIEQESAFLQTTLKEPVVKPAPFALKREAIVFEVNDKMKTAAITEVINKAIALNGKKPVVHFAKGEYILNEGWSFPAGNDVRIQGDGLQNTVVVFKTTTAAIKIAKQTCLHFSRLQIRGDTKQIGLLVDDDDKAGNVFYASQVGSNNATGSSIKIEGFLNTKFFFQSLYHGPNATSVYVKGSTKMATTPNVIIYGGASTANKPSYWLANNANMAVLDCWYEDSESLHFLRTEGNANFTLNGSIIAVSKKAAKEQPFTIGSTTGNIVITQTIMRLPGNKIEFGNAFTANLFLLGCTIDNGENGIIADKKKSPNYRVAQSRFQRHGSEIHPNEGKTDMQTAVFLKDLRSVQPISPVAVNATNSLLQLHRVFISGFSTNISFQLVK
ncbi:MAG: hypothetical protein EAZ16_08700 [Sphingobacteriales bacterium]|nr:MAG: hypothetical protein EAZ16_08700 [Sphingobacteriales bacterium]